MFANKTGQSIKKLKKIVRYVFGIVLIGYIGTLILLNIPFIQQKTTALIAKQLSSYLNTKVEIGRVNIGLLNRIIVDDLLLEDQSGLEMLKVTRLSVKFELLPLLTGRISIGSVQLFGFNIQLNKATPHSDPNFKFVLDAFAPKNKNDKKSEVDVRINSLLIRRGKFSYDVLSERETPGKFNPKHVKLYNIIGNISLKAFQNDSINAQIKRLSLDDQSGFELQKLTLKVLGNETNMVVKDFGISLPGTSLEMDSLIMNYDSLASFNNFMTDVRFSFGIQSSSYITLHDISPFVPALEHFKEEIKLDLDARGTIDQLDCPWVRINAGNHLRIIGNVSLQDLSKWKDAYIYGNLTNLSANRQGVDFLVRNFSKKYEDTPEMLKRLGDISFKGQISGYFNDLVTYGVVQTELGAVDSDLKFSSNRDKGIISYSGGIKTEDFEIGKLLANEKLDKISFNFQVQSSHQEKQYPEVILKGLISSLDYSNHQYNNITLDGEYKKGGFDGEINLIDDHGSFFMNGSFNLNKEAPTFNFNAGIKNLHPYMLNLADESYKDASFSAKLRANFTGGSIYEMDGSIDIDSLDFSSPGKDYFMKNMHILSTRRNRDNTLTINSEFMNARIEGTYNYRSLPTSIINMVKQYLPSLFPEKKIATPNLTNNNFIFEVNINNTQILSELFNIPLTVFHPITLKGYCNDDLQKMKFEAYFSSLQYSTIFIESGQITYENTSEELKSLLRMSYLKKKGIINFSMDLTGKNDQVDMNLRWGNRGSVTYSGNFNALADFSRTIDPDKINSSSLKTIIDIKPTQVILNDTVWNIHSSKIVADSKKVHIDNFAFRHQDQYLLIDGIASEAVEDSVKVDLKDINIGYVFDIFNLTGVDFEGQTTGRAIATRVFKEPIMNTRLSVKDFTFNEAILGNMELDGKWDDKEQGIRLDAHIKDEEGKAHVDGYIFPLRPKSGIDLHVDAAKLNARFIETYIKSIVSDISGRVSGKMHFYGRFNALNLEGDAFADAKFKVNILETSFEVKDSIYFTQNEMLLKDVIIHDLEGHRGIVGGQLRHTNFKGMQYELDIRARDLLVMRSTDFGEMPFYGTIYATGNASLSGNESGIEVDATLETNSNSTFVYSMASSMSATSNQFIKFVDKTPNRLVPDSLHLVSDLERAQRELQEKEEELDIDVRLNLRVEATPDATVRIIMDPISDDYISAKGNGNITLQYYNKGDVKMFGTYTISQGVYKFSLQEVIRKDFFIKEGSNVNFNGNPYEAIMNVQAIHTVNSVSLNDLIPDGLNGMNQGRVNVRVNCLMNLFGVLTRPNIRLGIELPNERDEIQALVNNYISTEEETNMQFLYLLSIGKFYPPTHLNMDQNSNVMSSVLSSTLSGQLNRMLSHILDNNNWSIGTNLSTGDKGWTDVEVQGILSGQLLNNRLLINGNFGYRDNPLATTNFVGDFEAEWLLTRSGDIRLKAYNQTNNRYYTVTSLTTQGIGIMYKKSFDRWKELLFWRRWRRNKEEKESPEIAPSPTDSIPGNPTSWINFK